MFRTLITILIRIFPNIPHQIVTFASCNHPAAVLGSVTFDAFLVPVAPPWFSLGQLKIRWCEWEVILKMFFRKLSNGISGSLEPQYSTRKTYRNVKQQKTVDFKRFAMTVWWFQTIDHVTRTMVVNLDSPGKLRWRPFGQPKARDPDKDGICSASANDKFLILRSTNLVPAKPKKTILCGWIGQNFNIKMIDEKNIFCSHQEASIEKSTCGGWFF